MTSTEEANFAGGVAVITGAGSGIGSGLARRAGEVGMTVVLADINLENAENVARDIRSKGGQAEAKQVDVSRPEELEILADFVFAKYGGVRLLVNNAGIETLGFCWEIPKARWESTLNINIHGVVHGVRAFAPRMISIGEECWIANLSSAGAFGMMPSQAAYIMTKHAVQSFTEGLFLDIQVARVPVHVCCVIPGLMRTAIFDGHSRGGSQGTERTVLDRYQQAMSKMARDHGMDIKQGSEIIMNQIAEARFWVHTHPEITGDIIQDRISFLGHQKEPEIREGQKHMFDF